MLSRLLTSLLCLVLVGQGEVTAHRHRDRSRYSSSYSHSHSSSSYSSYSSSYSLSDLSKYLGRYSSYLAPLYQSYHSYQQQQTLAAFQSLPLSWYSNMVCSLYGPQTSTTRRRRDLSSSGLSSYSDYLQALQMFLNYQGDELTQLKRDLKRAMYYRHNTRDILRLVLGQRLQALGQRDTDSTVDAVRRLSCQRPSTTSYYVSSYVGSVCGRVTDRHYLCNTFQRLSQSSRCSNQVLAKIVLNTCGCSSLAPTPTPQAAAPTPAPTPTPSTTAAPTPPIPGSTSNPPTTAAPTTAAPTPPIPGSTSNPPTTAAPTTSQSTAAAISSSTTATLTTTTTSPTTTSSSATATSSTTTASPTTTAASRSCGVSERTTSTRDYAVVEELKTSVRIVGGDPTTTAQNPWLVNLAIDNSLCGGSILDECTVLTAAHCVVDGSGNTVAPSSVQVNANDSSLIVHNDQISSSASQIIVHPGYSSSSSEPDHDLAIVKLSECYTFTEDVQPICLPEEDDCSTVSGEATVAGWGTTSEGGDISFTTPMEATLPVYSSTDCATNFTSSAYAQNVDQLKVCAGTSNGGVDSCQGDSGGPLMTFDDQGVATLTGVVSYGYGCARAGEPGIYACVATYKDWIQQNMEQ